MRSASDQRRFLFKKHRRKKAEGKKDDEIENNDVKYCLIV
jgi:hypothetical protein